MHRPTLATICRSSSRGVDSSTPATWPSIARTTSRSRTCSSACYSKSESRWIVSAAARGHSARFDIDRRSTGVAGDFVMPLPQLDRRTFLRSAGVAIGLPLLDAMLPIGIGAEQKAAALRAKRILLISRPLGYHAEYFFPEKTGKDYELTRYLKPLA